VSGLPWNINIIEQRSFTDSYTIYPRFTDQQYVFEKISRGTVDNTIILLSPLDIGFEPIC